ncbi:hypothetical protein ElyMa_001903100 [Elysia marginata]|uniref:Uncharacterized protein n=1 Tax=Elysia marginata TaxID=1093978 RepID=A0AAV4ERF2_9GAST|nr:hypothetical protein ElyMa_001903100 [Elysia marginata]
METDELAASRDRTPESGQSASITILNPERLAVKTMCGADILKNIVQSAERLSKIDKTLSRYLTQARLLLVWKRGSGAIKMAGSAAKTVGTIMLVAAPLHARFAMGMKVAHKLWKLGTSLKILNAIANMVRDVWQKGCREVLIEFTHCAATLTRNLGVYGEVVRDLQKATSVVNNLSDSRSSPAMLLQAVRDFIPAHQLPYATHVINMAFGNERYSPLFAFTSLTLGSENSSNIAQVMLEIESFHFDEFIENSESRSLVAIGSFLHVSRELCDFLDGFQHLTERDCQFLQECLQKLATESVSIMKAVAVLTSLDKIRKQLSTDSGPTFSQGTLSLYDNRDVAKASSSSSELNSNSVVSGSDTQRAIQTVEPTPSQECTQANSCVQEMLSMSISQAEDMVASETRSLTQKDTQSLTPDFELTSPAAQHVAASEDLVMSDVAACEDLVLSDVAASEDIVMSDVAEGDTQSSTPDIELTSPAAQCVAVSEDLVMSDVAEGEEPCPDQNVSKTACQECEKPAEQSAISPSTQTPGLVARLVTPISSAIGRGSSAFVNKSNYLLPFSFYKTLKGRGQAKSVERGDQVSEGLENCNQTRL